MSVSNIPLPTHACCAGEVERKLSNLLAQLPQTGSPCDPARERQRNERLTAARGRTAKKRGAEHHSPGALFFSLRDDVRIPCPAAHFFDPGTDRVLALLVLWMLLDMLLHLEQLLGDTNLGHADGSISDLVEWQAVSPDDVIFVPAGTIHAIGAGLVIAEIQQLSDATFRLFDYGRQRELHIESVIH